MEYFKLLNLEKEPFSNSPDPDCFFKSRQHEECLQKLELSLRLRRGLNVVLGEVGTGKTTLCRQLIKKFSRDESFETHLILDPHMTDPAAFLKYVAGMFVREPDTAADGWAGHKEFIKSHLYKKGVDEDKIVVLIIDEGQKIPPAILEILRELLNYETNEYKLLQIVIFAQREFEDILEKHENFADRINLLHLLGPLGLRDTRLMIDYRLQKAGSESGIESMLSLAAQVAIYRTTGGYPRKIVNLCHRVMLAMIVKNKRKAGWRVVKSCINRSPVKAGGKWQKAVGSFLLAAGLAGGAVVFLTPGKLNTVRELPATQSFPITGQDVKAVLGDIAGNPGGQRSAAVGPERQPATAEGPEGRGVPVVTGGAPTEKKGPMKADVLPKQYAAPSQPRPQTLGMVRLKDKETLSWVMIKVYGEYTNVWRQKVAAGNPGIKDLDNIYSGQTIDFPAEVYSGKQPPAFLKWIRVDRVETLDAALDTVRRLSTETAPLRVIPHWSHAHGLLFDVIFWKYFETQEDAQAYLSRLPDPLPLESEIIPGWGNSVELYANPGPGAD